MQIVYARQPLPAPDTAPHHYKTNSIFLIGPTPRDRPRVVSWRPEALKILAGLDFDGHVFIPEDEQWGLNSRVYAEQTRWELQAIGLASAIAVWIPRDMADMPALTTNTEFGFCVALAPERVVLGTPPDAHKVMYQRQLASELNLLFRAFMGPEVDVPPVPCHDTLRATLANAIAVARRPAH